MNEFRGKTALITGASGGIGLECARQLAAAGANLVLVARSADKLEQVAADLRKSDITVSIIVADLAALDGVEKIVSSLNASGTHVEILINNAGVGDSGFFHESDFSKQLSMIQLNISSLVALTHQLLPGMVSRRYGRILNVASTAAFQPGPLMSVYYASKAFVLSFSEAIKNELDGTGVSVTALCPGPVETGFQVAAGIQKTRLLRSGMLMPVETVARVGLTSLIRCKAVVIPGVMTQIMATGVRFLPRSVVVKLARYYQSATK